MRPSFHSDAAEIGNEFRTLIRVMFFHNHSRNAAACRTGELPHIELLMCRDGGMLLNFAWIERATTYGSKHGRSVREDPGSFHSRFSQKFLHTSVGGWSRRTFVVHDV